MKPRVAPRAVRPRGKARRGSILGMFDQGATQARPGASPLECSGTFAAGSWVALSRLQKRPRSRFLPRLVVTAHGEPPRRLADARLVCGRQPGRVRPTAV